MNALQALPTLLPGVKVFDRTPDSQKPAPAGPYAVISDLPGGPERQLFRQADGHAPQVRSLPVLVTLYGAQGEELADLRTRLRLARRLPDLVTAHPGLPPLAGCSLGADVPVQWDATRQRPWAGVRLNLTYLE